MVDTFQILLFVVIIALAVIVSLVGFQVFLLLRELHQLVKRAHVVMDDLDELSTTARTSLKNLSISLGSAAGLISLAETMRQRLVASKRSDSDSDEETM